MKILITTDLYTTATNGVVTSIKNLTEELIKKGHDVRVLTISDELKSYRKDNVYYIRSIPFGVYPGIRMPISYRHGLIKELIEWKLDVIHSQCEFFSFQFALRISKITKAPIVHTYHTLYEQYVPYVIPCKRLGKYLVRNLSRIRLKRVQTVIAPTRKVEKVLLDYGLKNPICVIPSGISLEQHKKIINPEERTEKRRALGISENQQVIINLGRLGTEKNLEEILSFFADALTVKKDLVLLIVGDGPAKEQLKQLAQKLEISEAVKFAGMVKPESVQEYYQLGDLFVSASTSETQGLTYVEAAANGLPLLCRKDMCLADIISERDNGYTYTCKEEFLEALAKILADSDWRIRAGKRSKEMAAAFDKSAFGNAVEAIYESVIREA